MIPHILHPSCFCEIWTLCVSWITYDHIYIYVYIYIDIEVKLLVNYKVYHLYCRVSKRNILYNFWRTYSFITFSMQIFVNILLRKICKILENKTMIIKTCLIYNCHKFSFLDFWIPHCRIGVIKMKLCT